MRAVERKGKILVLDDDPAILVFARSVLSGGGYRVETFEDADRFMEAIRTGTKPSVCDDGPEGEAPDLLLVDINLPGTSGHEILEEVRSHLPGLPVVLITASGRQEDAVRALRAGAADFVTKPLSETILLSSADRAIETARLRRENERLTESLKEYKRSMEHDLDLARKVQDYLLDFRIPAIEGFRAAGRTIPWRGVSGDFIDIFPMASGRFGLAMVDISGHGVAASLISPALKGLARETLAPSSSPAEGLSILHERSERIFFEDHYACVIFAVIDGKTGEALIAKGGQEPAILSRAAGGLERLDPDGLPVGMDLGGGMRNKHPYADISFNLGPGDRLILYSDGLVEARDGNGNYLGDERLSELVLSVGGLPLEDAVDGILDGIRRFTGGDEFDDDLSILAVEAVREGRS